MIKSSNLNIKLFINNNLMSKVNAPCLFLDRDGVIIKDVNYISDPSKVVLEKGIKELIIKAKKIGWQIAIVTNQSGIYREYFSWDDYEAVNQKMIDLLEIPNPFSGIFACGENPEKISNYRKPSPEMIFELSRKLSLDLRNSILIGDRSSDLIAGSRARLKALFHVKTGHGFNERDSIKKMTNGKGNFVYESHETPIYFLDNLNSFDFRVLNADNFCN